MKQIMNVNDFRAFVYDMDWLAEKYKMTLLEFADSIERQLVGDLIRVDEASDILEVTERQVWNIADNPEIDIHRYNNDGTKKLSNKHTKTFLRRSEIKKYQIGKLEKVS